MRRFVNTKIFTKLNNFQRKLEEAALGFGIASLAVLLIINVISREFGRSIYFAEEISQFLIVFITFVGLSYGVRKARHIRMSAVFELVNERIKKVLVIIMSFTTSLMMFFLAYQAIIYVSQSIRFGQTTAALRLPYCVITGIAPVCFFLTGILYALTFVKNISTREVWISFERRTEYESEGQL